MSTDENINGVPSAPYAQRGDVSGMTVDQARAELATLGRAAQAPGRLERMEKLSAFIHTPASANVGKGEAPSRDFQNDPYFRDALSGKLGAEAQGLAAADLAEQRAREASADQEMTEQQLAEMDAAHEPKSLHDYSLMPASHPMTKALFEIGASPMVANLLYQTGDSIDALDDAGYDQAVDRAARDLRALPGGGKMVEEAATFLRSLPDDHPLLAAAVIAAATVPGLRELSRLQRRGKRAA
jgi:hypothetical protein